ncbi:hypothetical protein Trydic_g19767 [Trypoxylus dichotomus]
MRGDDRLFAAEKREQPHRQTGLARISRTRSTGAKNESQRTKKKTATDALRRGPTKKHFNIRTALRSKSLDASVLPSRSNSLCTTGLRGVAWKLFLQSYRETIAHATE